MMLICEREGRRGMKRDSNSISVCLCMRGTGEGESETLWDQSSHVSITSSFSWSPPLLLSGAKQGKPPVSISTFWIFKTFIFFCSSSVRVYSLPHLMNIVDSSLLPSFQMDYSPLGGFFGTCSSADMASLLSMQEAELHYDVRYR